MAKLSDDQIANLLSKNGTGDATEFQVSLDEIESFGNREGMEKMFRSIASYNRMLKEKITFINPALTKAIPFTRENLYLICAYTGSGKSTIAANISYPLWQEQKKVLIISNEESEQDVLFRIACLHLGYNFNDYKKGIMPVTLQKQVLILFNQIKDYVKVLDVNYKNGLTTKLEGVKSALNAVKKKAGYSCVLIDYYQLIQYSIEDKQKSRYDVLNDLRIFLGQYIKDSDIPVVLFAQLHSFGKRANPDLDSRIKECPAVIEPSTVIIEAIPDFENQQTDFRIAKDRFGLQGHRIQCGFDKGRFVQCDEEWEKKQQERRLQKLEDIAYGPKDDDQAVAVSTPAVEDVDVTEDV